MDTTIRIHYKGDRTDPYFEKCVAFIKSLGEEYYIACEQDAERDHIQAYVYMTKYKNFASLRDRVTKVLGVKGNKEYSVSKLRKSKVEYIAYLMKEGPGAFIASCSLDQTQAEAELLREAFIKNPPKARPQSIYQKIVYDIGNEHLVEPREIARKMLMWFYENGKLIPDERQLRRYVETYRFGKDPEKACDRIVEDMYRWE